MVINNLTKECNEIVNLSITRTYCTKLYINLVIRFVGVIIIQLGISTVFFWTKHNFFL